MTRMKGFWPSYLYNVKSKMFVNASTIKAFSFEYTKIDMQNCLVKQENKFMVENMIDSSLYK